MHRGETRDWNNHLSNDTGLGLGHERRQRGQVFTQQTCPCASLNCCFKEEEEEKKALEEFSHLNYSVVKKF